MTQDVTKYFEDLVSNFDEEHIHQQSDLQN